MKFKFSNLLGHLECGIEVLLLSALAQFAVVDSVREEVVQQGTKRQSIAP